MQLYIKILEKHFLLKSFTHKQEISNKKPAICISSIKILLYLPLQNLTILCLGLEELKKELTRLPNSNVKHPTDFGTNVLSAKTSCTPVSTSKMPLPAFTATITIK
jgi:hypothetical protein